MVHTQGADYLLADIIWQAGQPRCVGAWTLRGVRGLEQRLRRLRWPSTAPLLLDGSAIEALDTSGAALLVKALQALQEGGREVRLVGLQPEQHALVELARARLAQTEPEASAATESPGLLASLGQATWARLAQAQGLLAFIGAVAITLARALLHPRRLRWRALCATIEQAGVDALPIVALLAFLMGVVIAYQGGEQLKLYGANIFIVELVTLTMLREIAPLITAIIVAGRTGSAYTAQIGTMQATEEIDALRTVGIDPLELLVVPKLLALALVLPLLVAFADALSVLGGMVMAYYLLDVGFGEFLDRIPQTVSLASLLLGIAKAPLFAVVIALVGCYQGFQVSGGADSVGRQTTVSVVQAIFLVIVVDALFAVLLGGFGL